jgi:hypothetical protein
MDPARRPAGFGCGLCFGEDAEAAKAYRLSTERDLVDESHFGVSIRRCSACAQRFVHVFTEFVDWADGDDPQYTDLLPVTDEEAARLASQGEQVDLGAIEAMGAARRRLVMSFPKGGPRHVFFTVGGLGIRPGG